jgi:hypothetical protein
MYERVGPGLIPVLTEEGAMGRLPRAEVATSTTTFIVLDLENGCAESMTTYFWNQLINLE